jgi:hypothetical protein
MPTSPNLYSAIEFAIRSKLQDMIEISVGQVISYDPRTQTAEVRPMVRRPVLSEDVNDYEDMHEELPVLTNVPVMQSKGNNTSIHIPLTSGDEVVLLAFKFDSSVWRQTGRISDAQTASLSSLTSCVAIPGLASVNRQLTSSVVSADNITIANAFNTVVVTNAATEFYGNTYSACLAEMIDQELSALQTAFAAWIPAPGINDSGAAIAAQIKAIFAAWSLGSTASQTIKAGF